MLLSKLLTEMTVDELKEHLASLRKVHSSGATTTVRRQSGRPAKDALESLREKLAKMTPDQIRKMRDMLG